MKIKILGLCIAIFVSSCKENTKETEKIVQREIPQYTIEQFMDNEAIGGGSFSHDNSTILLSSNRTGIYNVYTIPSKGGEMIPITASDSTSYFATAFFPEDNRMLISADGNGDEIDHIFVRDLEGNISDITPQKGAVSSFYGWSKDNKSMY